MKMLLAETDQTLLFNSSPQLHNLIFSDGLATDSQCMPSFWPLLEKNKIKIKTKHLNLCEVTFIKITKICEVWNVVHGRGREKLQVFIGRWVN